MDKVKIEDFIQDNDNLNCKKVFECVALKNKAFDALKFGFNKDCITMYFSHPTIMYDLSVIMYEYMDYIFTKYGDTSITENFLKNMEIGFFGRYKIQTSNNIIQSCTMTAYKIK